MEVFFARSTQYESVRKLYFMVGIFFVILICHQNINNNKHHLINIDDAV